MVRSQGRSSFYWFDSLKDIFDRLRMTKHMLLLGFENGY